MREWEVCGVKLVNLGIRNVGGRVRIGNMFINLRSKGIIFKVVRERD